MSDYILHMEDGTILCHHGVKGQKWGIRRYQNADGTLTKAGKKRYAKAYLYVDPSKRKSKKRQQREKEADKYFKSTKEYQDLVDSVKRDPFSSMARKANQITGERKGPEYRKAAKKVAEKYKKNDPSRKGKSYEEILNETNDIDGVNPDRVFDEVFRSLYNKSGRSKLDKKYNGTIAYEKARVGVSEILHKKLNTIDTDKFAFESHRLIYSILTEANGDTDRYKNW